MFIGYIFNPSNNECKRCPNGEYSLDKTDKICTKCPSNVRCINGSALILDPGFWRSNNLSNSINQCFNPDACLGDKCEYGYTGPLCDVCSQNFYNDHSTNLCITCNDATMSYIKMAIVTINNLIKL